MAQAPYNHRTKMSDICRIPLEQEAYIPRNQRKLPNQDIQSESFRCRHSVPFRHINILHSFFF